MVLARGRHWYQPGDLVVRSGTRRHPRYRAATRDHCAAVALRFSFGTLPANPLIRAGSPPSVPRQGGPPTSVRG